MSLRNRGTIQEYGERIVLGVGFARAGHGEEQGLLVLVQACLVKV